LPQEMQIHEKRNDIYICIHMYISFLFSCICISCGKFAHGMRVTQTRGHVYTYIVCVCVCIHSVCVCMYTSVCV